MKKTVGFVCQNFKREAGVRDAFQLSGKMQGPKHRTKSRRIDEKSIPQRKTRTSEKRRGVMLGMHGYACCEVLELL